jgi:hypothetical protein
VVALSALAATTASAAVFSLTSVACSGGTNVAVCYEGTDPAGKVGSWELSGKQSITTEGGPSRLVIPTLETLTIACTSNQSGETPVITQNSPLGNGKTTISGGDLVFKGCALTAPASAAEKCVIPKEKETVPIVGTLESGTEVKIVPASGTTFIELPFTSKSTLTCPAAFIGNLKIRGSQVVTIVSPAAPEKTKRGDAVAKSGLFYGESNAAELTGEITLTFTGLEDNVYVSTIS